MLWRHSKARNWKFLPEHTRAHPRNC